jgi:GNAT superfamily N-acetyltransferase
MQLEPGVLLRPGTHVVAQHDLEERQRVILYTLAHADVVLTPPGLHARIAATLDPAARLKPDALPEALPDTLRASWLNFVWYAGREPPSAPGAVRVLNAGDAELLAQLHQACPEQDRELGDVYITQPLVVGWFEDERLLAAASHLVDGAMADIGVLTHPDARGRGLGRAVVAETIRLSMRAGLSVQYNTQDDNIGSRRIAERLGLQWFLDERGFTVKHASSVQVSVP